MSTSQSRSKRITLADVAREAGVSIQTASHVMAGNMTVRLPQTTRDRVTAAAVKVGYRANRLAQAMKRGRTNIISVWMPLDRPTLSYMKQLQAINAHAHADGYDLMISGLDASMAYSAEGKAPYVWPVDGLIAVDAGKAITVFRKDPQNDSIPVAVLGLEQFVNSDSVAWDVMGAAHEATDRLLATGAKRIVHVTLDWILQDFPREQRRRGYSEAMVAAGLEPEFLSVTGENSTAAEQAMLVYLESHATPDAVFGFTDALAIGAARALLSKGVSIPERCQVVGYGDYAEGEHYRVPITSLRIPIQAVIDQAWSWLKTRIANPDEASKLAVLPMDIIVRESTRFR